MPSPIHCKTVLFIFCIGLLQHIEFRPPRLATSRPRNWLPQIPYSSRNYFLENSFVLNKDEGLRESLRPPPPPPPPTLSWITENVWRKMSVAEGLVSTSVIRARFLQYKHRTFYAGTLVSFCDNCFIKHDSEIKLKQSCNYNDNNTYWTFCDSVYCLKSLIFSESLAIVSVISAFFCPLDSFSLRISCALEVISFSCGTQ
jgi:hypothetical protein